MKKTSLSFVIFIVVLSSCTNEKMVNKIEWQDELDYFDGESAHYFVDVGTNKAYLGGVLEIYNILDNTYVDRITVVSFDLIFRSDGYPLCRIWGESGKFNKPAYLLARNCFNSD
tara:strand:+ start:1833 stop:2174 length:342 start_codon:yes stop_codon:yes gene_type:complete